ncbi:P-loop containing nucleoside triphosphate hydrolase protein, partial [Ascoidea rubescens DSM 1968]
IVTIGDNKCGKTSLINTFINNEFSNKFSSYSIFENYNKKIFFKEPLQKLAINFKFWDVSGHEDFDRMRPLIYADVQIILICFAINNTNSFNSILEKWIPEIENYCPNIPIILLGLKSDLRKTNSDYDSDPYINNNKQGDRLIEYEKCIELSKQINSKFYIECSAKEMYHIHKIFDLVAKIIISKE